MMNTDMAVPKTRIYTGKTLPRSRRSPIEQQTNCALAVQKAQSMSKSKMAKAGLHEEATTNV